MNLIKLSTILYPSVPGPSPRLDNRPKWVKGLDLIQANVELYIAKRNLIYFKTTGWHPGMQVSFHELRTKVVDVFTNYLWDNDPDYNRCEHRLNADQSCSWKIYFTENSNPRVLPKDNTFWLKIKAGWNSYWENEGLWWIH